MICLLKPLHFQSERWSHGFTKTKNPFKDGLYSLTVTSKTFHVNTDVSELCYSTTWTSMFETTFTEMTNDNKK